MLQIQHEIVDRFLRSPEALKIEADIAEERASKRRTLLSRLAKLERERDQAMVEPAKQLAEARAAVDRLFRVELPEKQAAAVAADAALGQAKGLHRREIAQIQATLAMPT